jgi:outer membrane receptor protein involved in Fe transport
VSAGVNPDTSSSGVLQEITVTARRRTESLMNVPVAVNVVTADTLQGNDATDLTKIAELVPQVIIGNTATGTGAVATIRGISSAPSDAGIDQSVSFLVDGVQLSRGRIVNQSMFDLQQVEVLEGPQALFFGKNSPAGVIVLRAQEPTGRIEGYLRGGYEFEAAERFGEGAISLPLAATFQLRFSFRASSMAGCLRRNILSQRG